MNYNHGPFLVLQSNVLDYFYTCVGITNLLILFFRFFSEFFQSFFRVFGTKNKAPHSRVPSTVDQDS